MKLLWLLCLLVSTAHAALVLVDSSSQAWDVEVDSNGYRNSTAISGSGPTTVVLNDQVLAASYLLSITTRGNLIYSATIYNSISPNSIRLHNPSGNVFLLSISAGSEFYGADRAGPATGLMAMSASELREVK